MRSSKTKKKLSHKKSLFYLLKLSTFFENSIPFHYLATKALITLNELQKRYLSKRYHSGKVKEKNTTFCSIDQFTKFILDLFQI